MDVEVVGKKEYVICMGKWRKGAAVRHIVTDGCKPRGL